MKTVFLDTNTIISGTFFSGPEAELLSQSGLRLVTADVCREELLEVTREKFDQFGPETKKTAVTEVENSLMDIDVIEEDEYRQEFDRAKGLIEGENDRRVLAAALSLKPDYFVTGDQDFRSEEIQRILPVTDTRRVLEELKTS